MSCRVRRCGSSCFVVVVASISRSTELQHREGLVIWINVHSIPHSGVSVVKRLFLVGGRFFVRYRYYRCSGEHLVLFHTTGAFQAEPDDIRAAAALMLGLREDRYAELDGMDLEQLVRFRISAH